MRTARREKALKALLHTYDLRGAYHIGTRSKPSSISQNKVKEEELRKRMRTAILKREGWRRIKIKMVALKFIAVSKDGKRLCETSAYV